MNETFEAASDWDGLERRGPGRLDDESRANKLLAKYRAGGVEAAASRDALVLQFRPLVQKLARQFYTSRVPFDDLVQEGFLGLMHGIEQYDPRRGVKLITYATHHIDGHLRHFLRDRVQIIKEPAWLQEAAQKVRRETRSLTQELGRDPTDLEVAAALGLTEAEVTRINVTRAIFSVASLDEAQETGSSAAHVVDDNLHVGTIDLPFEDRVVLAGALTRLKEIEQKVLYGFYYEDRTQTEIARELGVSNNYISHILKNSARKLQQMFRSDAVREAALQHERRRRRLLELGEAAEYDDGPITIVDPITGLSTAAYFRARLDEELNRAIRHNLELSIIRISVSNELTKPEPFTLLAQTIKDCMRRSDVVARVDNTEIAAMLPHTGAARLIVCDRVRQRFGEMQESWPKGAAIRIGNSSYPESRQVTTLMNAAEPAADTV